MALVAKLKDDQTTLDLDDGTSYAVLQDGIRFSPPRPRSIFASSAQRDGDPLVNTTFGNAQIALRLKVLGTNKPQLLHNLHEIQRLLDTARSDAVLGREPRVLFEFRFDGAVTTVWYDVLDGDIQVPETIYSAILANDVVLDVPLTLTCRPFCRGYERAMGKAACAVPREDDDPTVDEGIGVFGNGANVFDNPVFYTDLSNGFSATYTTGPDAYTRETSVRDQNGVVMPTAARIRMSAVNQGRTKPISSGTLATTWTFSCYLRGRGTCQIIVYSTGGSGSGTLNVALTDSWTRYSVTATITGSPSSVSCGIIHPGVTTYVDAFVTKVMFTRESFRSPFTPEAEYWAVDGSGAGSIYQLAPGHSWDGTAHASTSSRRGTTAGASTFSVATTGLRAADGVTIALWVTSRGWAWNDGVERTIWALGAGDQSANTARLVKDTANGVALEVSDAYGILARSIKASPAAYASDEWVHAVSVLPADGDIQLYLNGTAGVDSNDAGTTGRVETLPATLYLGSRAAGTNAWPGYFQVQAILPYAATAAQVAALYAAGRDGNHLAYIEANNNASSAVEADANAGTQTFTNRNGRVRLRDVQGQVAAPLRLRVYNPVTTAKAQAHLAAYRFYGIPAPHIVNLAADNSGSAVAAASAFGGTIVRYDPISTSSVVRFASASIPSDQRQRRYRVLLRAMASTLGDLYYAIFRLYYGAGVTQVLEKRVRLGSANYEYYDLGTLQFPLDLVRADDDAVSSWDMRLYVGNAGNASERIDADYIILVPTDREMIWASGLIINRWQSDESGYLVVDTRTGRRRVMALTSDETTGMGYSSAVGDGAQGDVLVLWPGDMHLTILGWHGSSWAHDLTWQIESLRYAPRYLVPPGL